MTDRPILLDTCAALWLDNASALSETAEQELQRAQTIGTQVFISPITAWEVGMLVSKQRLVLTVPPLQWFQSIIALGVDMAPISPDILVASSSRPDPILKDPADRIIAATARALNCRLMTRDGPLLTFARRGHQSAIAC